MIYQHKDPTRHNVPGYTSAPAYYPYLLDVLFANLHTCFRFSISAESQCEVGWQACATHSVILQFDPNEPGKGELLIEAREFRQWFDLKFEMCAILYYLSEFGAYNTPSDALYKPRLAPVPLRLYTYQTRYYYFEWQSILRLCPTKSAAGARKQIGQYPKRFSTDQDLIKNAEFGLCLRLKKIILQHQRLLKGQGLDLSQE